MAEPQPGELDALAAGAHDAPHRILGPHPHDDGWLVRVFRPDAQRVRVVADAQQTELDRIHPAGVFAGVVSAAGQPPSYQLELVIGGRTQRSADPYAFAPTLGALDLHLIGEGTHRRLWERLGARLTRHQGVDGAAFAVWAPHARAVAVIGAFNDGEHRLHPMRRLDAGVFEVFVPGVVAPAAYQFSVLDAHGQRSVRVDPLARRIDPQRSDTSLLHASTYAWRDDAWIASRGPRQRFDAPISVYELHVGSWRTPGGFRALTDTLPEYVRRLGFTHVELMPVMHHPFGGSWGYQVTGYYAPCARWGAPDDLKALIDALHQAGIGVILDFVPAHFPRDAYALGRFDGTALYEHPDPHRGAHPEWGTLIFDYGRPQVRNFLIASACYWLEEYHADGLRVDAVASMLYLDYSRGPGEWEPNRYGGHENLEAVAFLRALNAGVYAAQPYACTIAEESTAWPGVTHPVDAGGLGFGFKWNMGWMHDSLRYLQRDPVHRRHHHRDLTFALLYAFSEQYILAVSHDEVVHGKGSLLDRVPGDAWQNHATIRAFLAYMFTHPGKKHLFMGCELGQEGDWQPDGQLPWHALGQPLGAGLSRLVADLNHTYRAYACLWRDADAAGFAWIEPDDAAANTYSYLRRGPSLAPLVTIVNFSPVVRDDYLVALPQAGRWREALNTDAAGYGGSNVGNQGSITATALASGGVVAQARLVVPPLAALYLTPLGSETSAGPAA